MKEIKFRAWDGRKMWFFGLFGIPQAMEDGIGFEKDLKIMQYTRLKDCEGVEIYEGDIIETDGINKIVYYDKDEARFTIVNQKFFPNSKVIGNIHENKQLTK